MLGPSRRPGPAVAAGRVKGGRKAAGERIICVDDEPRHLAMLVELLRRLGYRPLGTSDGGQALQAVAEEIPDLVITDLQMPVVDGAALCRRLREQPATAHLPVLIVSGHVELAEVAQAAGADSWMGKPVTLRTLGKTVERLLAGATGRGSR